MFLKVYVIAKEIQEKRLYYSSCGWVPSCMFEDIHYFSKKSLAEQVMKEIKGDDETMHIKVHSLRFD
jgi:hypothetical protein